jgi:hypothetical protein
MQCFATFWIASGTVAHRLVVAGDTHFDVVVSRTFLLRISAPALTVSDIDSDMEGADSVDLINLGRSCVAFMSSQNAASSPA